jgi:hypothetical protein
MKGAVSDSKAAVADPKAELFADSVLESDSEP